MPKLLRQNVGGIDYSMVGCALSATCATPAATAAKVAVLSDGDTLADGMSVAVQFTEGNTAASPLTLTIGDITAPLCMSDGSFAGGILWGAGTVIIVLYAVGKFIISNFDRLNVAFSTVINLPAYNSAAAGGETHLLGSYTIPEDGVYAIDWNCYVVNNTNGGTSIGISIDISNVEILARASFFQSATAWSNCLACSRTKKFSKNDVVQFSFLCANPAECYASVAHITRIL